MSLYYDSAILNEGNDFNDVFDSLKSGAFVCCICHNTTYHRTVIKLEDQGFEIRDMILWITKDNHIPITLARKPLSEKTIVDNVLKYGVGGINIDESRIEPTGERLGGGGEKRATFEDSDGWSRPWMKNKDHVALHIKNVSDNVDKASKLGRFPANLLHDGSDEVEKLFPETISGSLKKGDNFSNKRDVFFDIGTNEREVGYNSGSGSASRYFKKIKDKTELIEYLKILITPKDGKVYGI